MKGYTNKTEIENYLLTTIDSSFDTQIEHWIEDMEAYIDNYTSRNFIADSVESERLYDGDGTRELVIDDAVSVGLVKIDGVELQQGDGWAYPANKNPKNLLKLGTKFFTRGNQNVSVTGKWGYSENCPADIRRACTILVAGIINVTDRRVQSETVGSYSVTYTSEKTWSDFYKITEILDSYRKFVF